MAAPTAKRERAKFYRYGGIVVRIYKGKLEPVRVFGRLVRAGKGQFPRAAMSYAPLPKRYRRMLADQAAQFDREHEDRERRARLAEQGIETPKRGAWTDLGAVPSGAIA